MELVTDVDAHDDAIFRLRWSHSGELLATPSRDGTTKIWRRSGEHLATIAHGGVESNCVVWREDDAAIGIGLDGGKLLLADPLSGAPFADVVLSGDLNTSVARSDDLLVAGDAGVVWAVDWRGGRVTALTSVDEWIFGLDWNAESEDIAIATREGSVLVVSDDRPAVEWSIPGAQMYDVAYVGSHRQVACASNDGVVRVLDPSSRTIVAERLIHTGRAHCCRVAGSDQIMGTIGADGRINLLDVSSLRVLDTAEEQVPQLGFSQLDFHPKGGLVAAPGKRGRSLRIWSYDVDDESRKVFDVDRVENGGSDAVFISYTRRDRRRVKAFVDELDDRGIYSWMDVNSLSPGSEWIVELQRAIHSAKAILVFVGGGQTGPWAKQEIQLALRRRVAHGIPLIPILLDREDAEQKLNSELAFLGNYQWVDAGDPRAVAAVADALRRVG